MPRFTGYFKALIGNEAEPSSLPPSLNVSLANTEDTIPPEPGSVAKLIADLASMETEAMEEQSSLADDSLTG